MGASKKPQKTWPINMNQRQGIKATSYSPDTMDEEIRYSKAALSRDRREFCSTQRERKSGGNSAVESGRVVANIKCGFDVTLAGVGTLLKDCFFFARSQGQISPIALITTFFHFFCFSDCETKTAAVPNQRYRNKEFGNRPRKWQK